MLHSTCIGMDFIPLKPLIKSWHRIFSNRDSRLSREDYTRYLKQLKQSSSFPLLSSINTSEIYGYFGSNSIMFLNLRCEERVCCVPLIHKNCNVDPPSNKKKLIYQMILKG